MRTFEKFNFLLIFLFISFANIGCDQIPQDEKTVNTVMARNAKLLANKYHMFPCAVGISMPEGDIQYLNLEFKIYGPLSRDEIRKILINAAHDFLEDANADSELCAYLKNHALSIKDIGIVLYLVNSSGRDLMDPYIGIAEITRGVLRYNILIEIYDTVINKEIPQFKSEYKESYEEALDLVKKT